MKKYFENIICAQNFKKYLKNNQQLILKARKKIKDAQLFALRCDKSALCNKWHINIYILSSMLKRICNGTRRKSFI